VFDLRFLFGVCVITILLVMVFAVGTKIGGG
jgi:hypothetical protein